MQLSSIMLLLDSAVFVSFWIDNRIGNAILMGVGAYCALATFYRKITINDI